jgi:cellulose synthase/poly-beta-1,6-N-acetylglucosamine synthase-like glycosyltransferase
MFFFFAVLNTINLVYLFFLNTVYLLTSIISFGALRKYARRLKSVNIEHLLNSAGAPPISLLVPSYNEEATCVESVRALLNLQYPDYEILVINDGSKDGTLKQMLKAYQMEPMSRMPLTNVPTANVKKVYRSEKFHNLWLIDKVNGGKADALNVGLNFSNAPLFCAIDADSLIERDALLRVVRPFLENAETIAAGGIIRIANGCTVERGVVTDVRLPKSLWARFQVLEYLRAFLSGRMGWSVLGGTIIISGAFGVFRRALVVSAGGYDHHTVGEDMELIVRLHRYAREKKMKYDIAFVPDPVAWTECPENMRTLSNQRDRWQRGLVETLFKHRIMLFNPTYGRVGLMAYPYYFFFEMLGPIIEVLGYISVIALAIMGRLSPGFAIAFLLIAFAYGSIISVFAVALEELTFRRYQRMSDLVWLMVTAVFENIGYRQLVTFWRMRGILRRLFSRKTQWGKMERKGFQKKPV